MTVSEFIHKHSGLYRKHTKEGQRNKILMLVPVILGLLFIFIYVSAFNDSLPMKKQVPRSFFYFASLLFSLASIVALFISNPHSFISTYRVIDAKVKYKIDLFELLTARHPEILEFDPGKKITAVEFCKSGLFDESFEDYNGDDLMEFPLDNNTLTMCELRVTRLFRTVFKGLFICCHDSSSYGEFIFDFERDENNKAVAVHFSEKAIKLMRSYCRSSGLNIKIKKNKSSVYMAIERQINIFERDSLNSILTIEEQFDIFENNFEIARNVISDLNNFIPTGNDSAAGSTVET